MSVSDALAATATPYTPPSQRTGYAKQAWGVAYQVRRRAESILSGAIERS